MSYEEARRIAADQRAAFDRYFELLTARLAAELAVLLGGGVVVTFDHREATGLKVFEAAKDQARHLSASRGTVRGTEAHSDPDPSVKQ